MHFFKKLSKPLHAIDKWLHKKSRHPFITHLSEALPEVVSFPTGMVLTDIQGIPKIGGVTLPLQGQMGLAIGWNYFDALDSIMAGINSFLDKYNHHKIRYVQGALDILSAAQAFTFTYCPPITAAAGLGVLALAGPAFAFMTLCDFINSIIDLYYPAKELKFKGWLKEKIHEVNFLLKNILKLEFKKLQLHNSAQSYNKIFLKEQKIEKKILQLTVKRNQLFSDISVRCRVYIDKIKDDSIASTSKANDKVSQETEKDSLLKLINSIIYANNLELISKLQINQPPSIADFERDKAIQKEILATFKAHRLNFILKGLSLVGMSLIAIAPFTGPIAPFLLIPGLVIASFVAGFYIYKHHEQIKKGFCKIVHKISDKAHTLFSHPPSTYSKPKANHHKNKSFKHRFT